MKIPILFELYRSVADRENENAEVDAKQEENLLRLKNKKQRRAGRADRKNRRVVVRRKYEEWNGFKLCWLVRSELFTDSNGGRKWVAVSGTLESKRDLTELNYVE
jgi:hypothetical protein